MQTATQTGEQLMVNSVTLRRITIKSQNKQNETTKNISCKLNLQSHSGARVVYYVVHKGEARVLHTAVYTQVNR